MSRKKEKKLAFWVVLGVALVWSALCVYSSLPPNTVPDLWIAPPTRPLTTGASFPNALPRDEEPWLAMTETIARVNLNRLQGQANVDGVPTTLQRFVGGEWNERWAIWFWGFTIPKWAALWLFCPLLLVTWGNPVANMRRWNRKRAGTCEKCEYSIRDLPATSPCPECGTIATGTKP